MKIEEINDANLQIVPFNWEEYLQQGETEDDELGNSGLWVSDFHHPDDPDFPKLIEIKAADGSTHEMETFYPEESVWFAVVDTKEVIASMSEFAGVFSPNKVHWFRVNGQLVCEFWWD